MKHILIAVDGSETSEFAFQYYLDTIMHSDDCVTLVHVYEHPSLPMMALSSGVTIPQETWERIIKEASDNAAKILKVYSVKAEQAKLKYKAVRVTGDARDIICDMAKELHADLVCIGSRGLGAVKRLVLGSTSTYVAQNCSAPVLIVKPKH